jgi:Trk K+ transport system NAD-binding subunit
MRIGIIGSGNIGGTLTRRLSGLGHEVADLDADRARAALSAA